MKISRLLLSFLAGIALIFELLPNGVVLRFMNPEGEPIPILALCRMAMQISDR